MSVTMGKPLKEWQTINLKDGREVVVVIWENPGQLMRLQVDDPFINWRVQAIGLVVEEFKGKEKKRLTKVKKEDIK